MSQTANCTPRLLSASSCARCGFAVSLGSASFSDSAMIGPYFAQNASVYANSVAE